MVKDMTKGNPMKIIIRFCLPLMMGNLFQQFYNMADTIIVGKFVGKTALSAVGSVGPLNFLVIGSILGLCTGFAIPIAQSFGAQDFKKLMKITANIIYTSVAMGVLLTVAVIVFTKPLLRVLNTPDDIFQDAYNYIVIIFIGIGATMLYNIVSSIIRSLGDSKTPLYFLIFSSFLNIGLDLLLIIVFKMGVRGAAIATVISQFVSGILCLVFVIKNYPMLHFQEGDRKVDFKCIKELVGNGVPMALQCSITAVGSVMLQSCVNTLGSNAIAAMTIGGKTQLMIVLPSETIGITMATYCGQNLGAKKYDRIKKGVLNGTILGIAYSFIAFFIARYLGSYIGLLFIDGSETAVLALSQRFLNTCSWFYPVLTFIFIYRNSLQGLGYGTTAMFAGFFELAARGGVGFGFVLKYGFAAACFANPVAWFAADFLLIPAYFIVMKKLKKQFGQTEQIEAGVKND
ncbi:MAG: MATE family efflux transporter [Clostridia bacterium]|nr:MATE family efflux transporter [Clostridia bacterium]